MTRPGRRAAAVCAAAVVVMALSGCRVDSRVTVDDTGGGHGDVAVTVTLDAGAVAALGGPAALTRQLSVADLAAAGWAVNGPRPGPGTTEVISAVHPFDSPAQASALVSGLAGSGPASQRPFRLQLSSHRSFWHVRTALAGTVDLRCGLSCFGDAGLKTALGNPLGVDPAAIERAARQQPAQVFSFGLQARLPGSLHTTDGARLPGGAVQWTPVLGRTVVLSATTRDWNWGNVVLVVVLAGVAVLGVMVLLLLLWRRRRRRRSAGGGGPAHLAGSKGPARAASP